MNKYQFEEYIKCLSDKSRIYFIENYLSTFNADERKEVPFKLFPRQKVYLKTLVGNDNIELDVSINYNNYINKDYKVVPIGEDGLTNQVLEDFYE